MTELALLQTQIAEKMPCGLARGSCLISTNEGDPIVIADCTQFLAGPLPKPSLKKTSKHSLYEHEIDVPECEEAAYWDFDEVGIELVPVGTIGLVPAVGVSCGMIAYEVFAYTSVNIFDEKVGEGHVVFLGADLGPPDGVLAWQCACGCGKDALDATCQ